MFLNMNNRPWTRIVFATLVMCVMTFGVVQRASATGSDDDVKHVQQTLSDKGYNPGPVDGQMGPQTRDAIGKYQKDQGLKITHHIDSNTADKMGVPQESAGNTFKSAGKHFAKGGKDFGKEIANGHPGDAGKDLGKNVGEGGKQTGEGVKKSVDPNSN
jgi:peptidoglycan hydrolase-like protein with peptidoglycan-binding domain